LYMPRKTTKYPLVLIRWVDSTLGFQGWKWIEDEPKEISIMVSVGFLIYEDKDVKILCPHIKGDFRTAENILATGDIKIPVSAIRKIKVLQDA
jgi:hypothetical protein